MLRAAAKNHGTPEGGVTVVIDPSDYARILADIDGPQGQPSYGLRLELATKAYAHTAAYDGAIAAYLSSLAVAEPEQDKEPARDPWPQIGRASCRESVCQYVEISGVAVSLKK